MPTNLQRRLWLKQALAVACATSLPLQKSFANKNAKDIIFGGGRYQETVNGPFKYVISKITPQTGNIQTIPTPFFPHGFAVTQAHIAYVFEKIGKGAGLVKLDTMEWLASIPPVSNRQFYGHGACSKDGQLLYSTETSPDEKGAIGIRDTKTLDYLGDFPTYGANPHDCHLIDDGNVLLVTNGGGTHNSGLTPSICYIDINSQKLLERIEMTDDRFNTGHTVHTGNHQAITVSAPRKGWGTDHIGAVSIQKNHRLEVLSQPTEVTQQMFGEALSIEVVPEKDLFIATHPTPGMVTFWQLSTQKLLKRLDLPHARGIALAADKESVWISYHQQAHLVRVMLGNLNIDEVSRMANTFISGSHLINRP